MDLYFSSNNVLLLLASVIFIFYWEVIGRSQSIRNEGKSSVWLNLCMNMVVTCCFYLPVIPGRVRLGVGLASLSGARYSGQTSAYSLLLCEM